MATEVQFHTGDKVSVTQKHAFKLFILAKFTKKTNILVLPYNLKNTI